jgi:hypothetical protein
MKYNATEQIRQLLKKQKKYHQTYKKATIWVIRPFGKMTEMKTFMPENHKELLHVKISTVLTPEQVIKLSNIIDNIE